jgi:hypothetical protein
MQVKAELGWLDIRHRNDARRGVATVLSNWRGYLKIEKKATRPVLLRPFGGLEMIVEDPGCRVEIKFFRNRI